MSPAGLFLEGTIAIFVKHTIFTFSKFSPAQCAAPKHCRMLARTVGCFDHLWEMQEIDVSALVDFLGLLAY